MSSRKNNLDRQTEDFGKRLCRLMQERGYSVRLASEVAEVSASTISNWRAGVNPTNFRAVQRLAAELGVSLSYLLTGTNDQYIDAPPEIDEVFSDGGEVFSGYLEVQIRRIIRKTRKDRK